MLLLEKIQKAVRHPGLAYSLIRLEIKEAFLWDYYYNSIPGEKIKSCVSLAPRDPDEIVWDLGKNGIDVLDYEIDIRDFRKYMETAGYQNFEGYYTGKLSDWLNEKALEHYLAAKCLELQSSDIYVDVAACNSPAANIYENIYGCTAYRQDMIYREGIHGKNIGGTATAMPVPNSFATKMALHCSFEHFEGNSDIDFIVEAQRVLSKGGKLCIVPLYLHNDYALQSDPACLPKGGIDFDEGPIVCAQGWRNRFGRFYDVPHFVSRIVKNLQSFKLTIYRVLNEKEIDKNCYLKFFCILQKP